MDEYIVDVAKRYQNQPVISKQKLMIEYMLDFTRADKLLDELLSRGLLVRDGDDLVPHIDDRDVEKLRKEYAKAQKKALKAERKHAKRM